jgi:putative ABC transport system permease protein
VFDLDKWQEIWLTIRQHKLRTALTCFGVFWGIFMLVVLLGAGKGLHNGALQGFDIARNSVFLWTRETAVPFAGFDAGRPIRLSNEDMVAARRLPEVDVLAARLRVTSSFGGAALTIERGTQSVSYTIMGDEPSFLDIQVYDMVAGRFINELDMAQRRKVAVIGTRVRDELFDPDDIVVGAWLRIGGVPFQVVGVFDTRTVGEQAMQTVQTTHIPLTTAQRTFNRPNRVDWFGVLPAAGLSAAQTQDAVNDLLRTRHRIAPSDQQALAGFNVEQAYLEMQGIFNGIGAFSWLVAIGTILAGMVGVANIMLIVVRERTREIGIRKALGARPGSIVGMIVLEASVLSGLAGYIGLLAGVALIEGIAALMQRLQLRSEFFADPEIDFPVAVTAIAVLLLSGVLAGLFPGLKAARVDPVVALQDE